MVITRHGAAFIKIQQGDTVFAFNPVSRDYDSKATKFGADIALVSLNDPSMNGTENVSFGSKEPLIIKGPGEYEIGGVFVRGFQSSGPDGKINTIYTTLIEGIRLCHLGGLTAGTLDPNVIEEIGEIDVLFVPIGGSPYLSPKDAAKLATSLEAKIVVPILYNGGDSLKVFLKESGEDNVEPVEKLSIKKKDVEGKEGQIIVINS